MMIKYIEDRDGSIRRQALAMAKLTEDSRPPWPLIEVCIRGVTPEHFKPWERFEPAFGPVTVADVRVNCEVVGQIDVSHKGLVLYRIPSDGCGCDTEISVGRRDDVEFSLRAAREDLEERMRAIDEQLTALRGSQT
jgi:hypothetical protein